ncbi:hypothetical protein AGABI2DRAFT_190132, partial [Agaricus bisporus var. bisporus H97]|uniref:hypothetical protein n=1 Tax=Agaricus bisporus var. bisporus (strain H97 / ATCC MYA-4626 / FGSC 10389) TaxID=936046 RepID=UPI00029F7201
MELVTLKQKLSTAAVIHMWTSWQFQPIRLILVTIPLGYPVWNIQHPCIIKNMCGRFDFIRIYEQLC